MGAGGWVTSPPARNPWARRRGLVLVLVPGHGRAVRHGVLAFRHSRIGSVWRAVRVRLHRRSGGCLRGRLRLSTTRQREHENDTCAEQQPETGFYHHLTSMRRRRHLRQTTCPRARKAQFTLKRDELEPRARAQTSTFRHPSNRDTRATWHRKKSGSVRKQGGTIEPPAWRSCRVTPVVASVIPDRPDDATKFAVGLRRGICR
jgi:hypothetical protein